jgi:hypothetical protein
MRVGIAFLPVFDGLSGENLPQSWKPPNFVLMKSFQHKHTTAILSLVSRSVQT